MASHITHVVYGKKIYDRLNTDLSWQEFVVGTLFPDIRYVAKVDRKTTHLSDTSKEKIPTNNSFYAGMYTHALVDEARQVYLNEKGIYEHINFNWVNVTAIKLLEDEVLYEKYDSWNEVIKFLDTIYPEEEKIVNEIFVIKKWHKYLKEYFYAGPNEDMWFKGTVYLTKERSKAENLVQATRVIRKNIEVIRVIKDFYKYI